MKLVFKPIAQQTELSQPEGFLVYFYVLYVSQLLTVYDMISVLLRTV